MLGYRQERSRNRLSVTTAKRVAIIYDHVVHAKGIRQMILEYGVNYSTIRHILMLYAGRILSIWVSWYCTISSAASIRESSNSGAQTWLEKGSRSSTRQMRNYKAWNPSTSLTIIKFKSESFRLTSTNVNHSKLLNHNKLIYRKQMRKDSLKIATVSRTLMTSSGSLRTNLSHTWSKDPKW